MSNCAESTWWADSGSTKLAATAIEETSPRRIGHLPSLAMLSSYIAAAFLYGHARGEQQVLRQHLAYHDCKKIHVQNSRGRLRRSNLRRLPRQVREHGRAGEAKQDPLPEKDAAN